MARTQSEQYPEIQRNILKRAAAVFARVGYVSSTITDLAKAIKVSRGALYHYFPSKEAILYGILDNQTLAFLEVVEEAMQSSHVAVEQLRSVTKAIVEFNARSSDEQVILLNDLDQLAVREREAINDRQREILDRLSDLLIRVDTQGKITPGTKRVYTMMYLGIINYTFAWYDPNGKVKPAEFADLATDLFLNGFLGEMPARTPEQSPALKKTAARATSA